MAPLLKSLRPCKEVASCRYPLSATMLLDIQWWLDFLPRFHHVSLIKPSIWDFKSFCQFFPLMRVLTKAAPLVNLSTSALSSLIVFLLLFSTSTHLNFSRSLSLSSIGLLSYRAILLQSILPHTRILLCSVFSEKFGSPYSKRF